MTTTTPGTAKVGEHRNLLAAKVVRARTDLNLTSRERLAEVSGVSLRIISDIEKGRRTNFTESTKAKLERALGWEPGSVDAVLAGWEPIRPANAPRPDPVVKEIGDDLETDVRAILSWDMPDGFKYQVVAAAQRLRARQAAERRRLVAQWLEQAERVRQHGTLD